MMNLKKKNSPTRTSLQSIWLQKYLVSNNVTLLLLLLLLIKKDQVTEASLDRQFVQTRKIHTWNRNNTSTAVLLQGGRGGARSSDDKDINHVTPFQLLWNVYSKSLDRHPFITKGATGFFLCAVSDVIAQLEKQQHLEFSKQVDSVRMFKFAIKGFFATSVWSPWYDFADRIISRRNVITLLQWAGINSNTTTTTNDKKNSSVANICNLQIILQILLEQFVGSPIYYGLYEIPVATLMNGAPVSRIPLEIKAKLMDILFANALVWTGANWIIYNAPLKHRIGLCNVFTVLWNIIMSDFAAHCGTSS